QARCRRRCVLWTVSTTRSKGGARVTDCRKPVCARSKSAVRKHRMVGHRCGSRRVQQIADAARGRNLPVREPRNQVVQVRRFGGPDGLEVVEAALPTAGRGEVRVRVLASGLEYTDVTIRRHLYPWVLRRPPFAMGYDVVGEIDQLGAGVRGLQL